MYISYSLNGRFGNNLFQYLATKILQHKLKELHLEYTYIFHLIDNNAFVIKENDYLGILTNLKDYLPKLTNKNIYLDGYFQYDSHIREHKEYISSEVCVITNNESINHTYTVSHLINILKQTENMHKDNSLTIHIRLDDFIPEKVCMKVGSYLKILAKIIKEHTFESALIVVDKLRHKFEQDYINCIHSYLTSNHIQVSFHQGTLLEDFSLLYHSPYFLSSNSTFSYLAGLLGKHTKSWCPVNTRYDHQHISIFDNNTEPFSIEYVTL